MSRERIAGLALAAILAVACASVVAYTTRGGPWAYSDSVGYVQAARNLAHGYGPLLIRASGRVVPVFLHPPLYPILLAAFLVLGLDPVTAGRSIAIILSFSLVFALSLATNHRGHSFVIPLALAIFFVTSTSMIKNSSGLMSEPLFLFLVVLQLILTTVYWRSHRTAILALSAIMAGLALLTRFTGIASLGVTLVAPLLVRGQIKSRQVAASALGSGIAALPLLLWVIWIRARGDVPRSLHLPTEDVWHSLQPVRLAVVRLVWSWLPLDALLPIDSYRVRALVSVGFVGLILLVALLFAARDRRLADIPRAVAHVAPLGFLLVAFSALHMAVVGAGYLLTDPTPDLSERIFFPSHVTLIAGLVLLVGYCASHATRWAYRLALPIAMVLPLAWAGLPGTRQYISGAGSSDWGYTSELWQDSPILERLGRLPSSLAIVTNDADAVSFYLGREAFRIPELEAGVAVAKWDAFGSNPASTQESLFATNRAALVIFSLGRDRFSPIYGDQAEERLHALTKGLYVEYSSWDGAIYLATPP